MSGAPLKTRRWDRRRADLIRAAESVFAEKGFAAARLEDVAERVGMRRPSLLYYFRDKTELYQATYAQVLADLLVHVEAAAGHGAAPERVEALATSWLEFLGRRPEAARLILRQVVDVVPPLDATTLELIQAIVGSVQRALSAGRKTARFAPSDAGRYAVLIAGASLFWVTARPIVHSALALDTLSPENLEAHKEVLVRLTRQLLETGSTRPAPGRKSRAERRPRRRRIGS